MGVIGDVVLEFVAETVALTVVFGLTAAAVAGAARLLAGGRIEARAVFVASLAGAMIVAALADRLGAPRPWVLQVGRRAVPMAWSAAGAVLGAGAWAVARWRGTRSI